MMDHHRGKALTVDPGREEGGGGGGGDGAHVFLKIYQRAWDSNT